MQRVGDRGFEIQDVEWLEEFESVEEETQEELINKLYDEIDQMAKDVDSYAYGLPMYDSQFDIKNWIRDNFTITQTDDLKL